ncbi:MAG: UPF0175 family protein [bacterium]
MLQRQITLNISEDILVSLNKGVQELCKEMLLEIALRYYKEKRLSLGKSAELALMNRNEFLETLSTRKIVVFDYDLDEVEREFEGIYKLRELEK